MAWLMNPKSGLAQRCKKDSQSFYHCVAGPCNTPHLQWSSLLCLARWWQPGGFAFLGISLFSKSSDSRAEAVGSADFKAAVIDKSVRDWAGSPQREKAALPVACPRNGCVPPGHQLQPMLVVLRVSCAVVPCCMLC